MERKQRSDAGTSIIGESGKKRRKQWTARFAFEKLLRNKNPDTRFTSAQIDEQWEKASSERRNECQNIVKVWKEQGPFLLKEIQNALQNSGGSLSWRNLANVVAGAGNLQIVSAETIRRYVMSLPESTYKTTRILPKLDEANKQRRLWWAHQFWIFWNSAVAFNGVQIVLVHRDEKWFFEIVVRRNLKYVPELGVAPVQHGVQHKSHIGKIMVIASTAFAPKGNDITQGGEAFLVNLVRVGRMEPAKKNTYKRVYDSNGKYHYPKIPANLLRRRGQLYFKSLEVTGSNPGTEKEPKFPLVKYFEETELPKLDLIAAEVARLNPGKKVIIRDQMDSAGPHKDQKLNNFLEEKYDERGWQIVFQPSNSPITNVKDDCVFPALSRHVSQEQGITKGSQLYQPDELWEAVQKCWTAFPLDTLARAYVRHAQIASAIAECEGGDDFVREKKGLHFGVRNSYVPLLNEEGIPTGVALAQEYENVEDDEHHDHIKLQYKKPDLDKDTVDKNLARMPYHELDVLHDNLPLDHDWFEQVQDAYHRHPSFMEEQHPSFMEEQEQAD